MDNIYLRWWGCGHFDILMGDVNVSVDPYLFGENLDSAEPIFDYIFISHEHFDHCHPETLKKLCRGPRFKKLFVSPGCLTPNEPIESYGLSAFARDLPIDQHVPREMIQVVYPKYRADPGEDFPGPQELDLG
ncbi:MAG: MBL fold metallo-hydrolase, partial [Candidatus Poribacteria bacterium]|nr:MBL fold metallo-hydrolase [Candidatus Poribacteria bacterium]